MAVKQKSRKLVRLMAAVLVLVLSFSLCICVSAAPEVLSPEVSSTAEGLVTLKAPEQLSTSTTNKKLPLSATAPQGVTVTVYRYNYATGNYHKIWVGDTPMESVIGSTMLYAGQLDLASGMNKFIIRGGWDDYNYTVEKFDVNVLNEGFMDRIKGIISVIFN